LSSNGHHRSTMPESPPARADKRPFGTLPLVQREFALLVVLCAISTVTFGVTRRLARWSRDQRADTAAQWFTQGDQLTRHGNLTAGTAALREAVAADRQNASYMLALARALADAGQNDEARQLLLQLRQTQPDDVEVNYRLARLAASAADVSEATRYYNLAMYGLVRIGEDFDRRQIRTELIAFLLDHNDRQEALTQLVALGRELPDEPGAHLRAARLADRVPDRRLALEHYARAVQLDPASAEAAVGAGEAAFALHEFAIAARELEQARSLGRSAPELKAHLETAQLVLATDPLGSRIAGSERTRRLLAGLARAADREDRCSGMTEGSSKATDVDRSEIDRLRRGRASDLRDADVMARAVELIGAIEDRVAARCPSLTEPIDQAWAVVAVSHRSGGS